jgi:hypothetical protein
MTHAGSRARRTTHAARKRSKGKADAFFVLDSVDDVDVIMLAHEVARVAKRATQSGRASVGVPQADADVAVLWRALGARCDDVERALDAGDVVEASRQLEQAGALAHNARLPRSDARVCRMLALKARRDERLFDVSALDAPSLFDDAPLVALTDAQREQLVRLAQNAPDATLYVDVSLSGKSATLRYWYRVDGDVESGFVLSAKLAEQDGARTFAARVAQARALFESARQEQTS